MRKMIFGAAAMLLAMPSAATPPVQPPPKLLIVISVDQLSADLFEEYRPHFTGGLARLASGTVFRNGFQSHATTETCPGHSTILTGMHPASSGMVANAWVDFAAPRTDKIVYCAEDENAPGTDHEHYKASTINLRSLTLGDYMKQAWLAPRVVAVSGKDRSALMMTGKSANQRWYWNRKGFETDLPYPKPTSVAETNAAVARMIAAPSPPLTAPPLCASKAQPVAIEGHAPVGAGAFARSGGDVEGFEDSPQYDAAVLALSAALVGQLGLGREGSPDLLAIGLSATDYVGHVYGTGGQEMCLQLLELDRDLGDFFKRLDSWGLDYAVALTADHGGEDIPERLRLKGVAGAARIDPDLTPKAVSRQVSAETGIAGPILADIGIVGDLYLDPNLKGSARERGLAAAAAIYRRHPQVEAAFTKAEIGATAMPSGNPTGWSLIQRARASFDPQRSGDLYVILKPHITPIGHARGAIATHGSPWDYDRRVPILFWRRGMASASHDAPADTVDILPTLWAWILPGGPSMPVDGHCLQGISGIDCAAMKSSSDTLLSNSKN